MVYRTDWANPNLGYVYKGEPLSSKRPQGLGRVPAQASGLKPSCWKAECVARRPLRLEGGKDCKVLPILTGRGRVLEVKGVIPTTIILTTAQTERIGDAVVVEHEPKHQVPSGYPGTSELCSGR